MSLIYFDTSGIATVAGIFIPRDNIFGLTANVELIASEPEIVKQCKFLAGFLASLESAIALNRANFNSLSTALGFTVTKGNPIGVEPSVFTQAFTASLAHVIDYGTSTFYPIPVPTSGSNLSRGVLKITDVFPDAISVPTAGLIAKAGILIPHSVLDAYGAATITNPTNDTQSRQWFAAMLRYLFNEIPIRVNTNTETFSAVITKSLGTVSSFTLPTDAFSSINPSTGLDPTKVLVNDVYSRTIQLNIEFLLNEKFRRFEVRTSINPNFNLPIVNITRPSVIEFLDVLASFDNSVEFINIRFSEVINLSTFNFNDISLTRDGSSNLINNSVTVEYISGTIYQIRGLTSLTSTPGTYQLTVNTNGIQNLAGISGNTTAQASFSINTPIITFVDNRPPITPISVGAACRFNQWLASSFKTGNNNNYSLYSVTLRFREDTADNNLSVSLYTDNLVGIGGLITTFTKPSFVTNTIDNYTFTLTTPQTLAANTVYWLIAGISSDAGGAYSWRFTNSPNQIGALGWSIGDDCFYSNNQGATWNSFPTDSAKAFQFSVNGR